MLPSEVNASSKNHSIIRRMITGDFENRGWSKISPVITSPALQAVAQLPRGMLAQRQLYLTGAYVTIKGQALLWL